MSDVPPINGDVEGYWIDEDSDNFSSDGNADMFNDNLRDNYENNDFLEISSTEVIEYNKDDNSEDVSESSSCSSLYFEIRNIASFNDDSDVED